MTERRTDLAKCPVYWGSHGCDLFEHEDGPHWCMSCCTPSDPEHMAAHAAAGVEDYGADGCAGTWPYYGHHNMTGPDAKLPFFRYEPPDWEFVNLPDEFERLAAMEQKVPT